MKISIISSRLCGMEQSQNEAALPNGSSSEEFLASLHLKIISTLIGQFEMYWIYNLSDKNIIMTTSRINNLLSSKEISKGLQNYATGLWVNYGTGLRVNYYATACGSIIMQLACKQLAYTSIMQLACTSIMYINYATGLYTSIMQLPVGRGSGWRRKKTELSLKPVKTDSKSLPICGTT